MFGKKLIRFLRVVFGLEPQSPYARELMHLERNIVRGESDLNDMYQQWVESGGACCPGCMFGSEYSELCDKQDRRRDRKAWLMKRLGVTAW